MGLKKSNFVETRVLATNAGINASYQIDLDKWHTDKNHKFLFTQSSGLLPIKLIFKSIKTIKKVDILHFNSLFYPPSLLLALINVLFYKRKMVVSVRGELYPFALNTFRPRLKRIFIKIWKLILRKITIHCTVEKEEYYVKSVFGDSVKTVLLPNYIVRPEPIKKDENQEKEYILFLGRLHKIKGLENLFKALQMSDNFMKSGLKLKLAGRGESVYEAKLKALSKALGLHQKIEFVGQVEGYEKEKLIANAYFLILPSFTENFGNVVVESLMHAVPAITSTGTPWSLLEKNKAGFWTENSVEALTKTIDKACALSKEQYIQYSKNAQKLAYAEYDIENNYQNWVSFYKELVN
ncbi:glycosyltransferase [Winogradskyella litorisediminis]|uniref:Glycosyltransferase n=1 Tax=Winogradskyella litorisediminis TaxID=1156618 RepID=A0ABW3N4L1_9FLAO